ncbi:hypothetical protein SKAU_G00040310 [Synaphobranchus kaupii]|uniref:Uncharacterized protein n=1 Tax=Synaphobranchus kaupii TaxID=118154 RepID=A0A9Q1G1D7_SYNKA|nr:hypothetical protein SKAU_G00040310 [Synaphobranchus kaupii]
MAFRCEHRLAVIPAGSRCQMLGPYGVRRSTNETYAHPNTRVYALANGRSPRARRPTVHTHDNTVSGTGNPSIEAVPPTDRASYLSCGSFFTKWLPLPAPPAPPTSILFAFARAGSLSGGRTVQESPRSAAWPSLSRQVRPPPGIGLHRHMVQRAGLCQAPRPHGPGLALSSEAKAALSRLTFLSPHGAFPLFSTHRLLLPPPLCQAAAPRRHNMAAVLHPFPLNLDTTPV